MKKWLKWLRVKVRYLRKQCKNMPDGRKKRYLSFYVTLRVVCSCGEVMVFSRILPAVCRESGFLTGFVSHWVGYLSGGGPQQELSFTCCSAVPRRCSLQSREMFTLLRMSSADLQQVYAAHYHTPTARYRLQGITGTYL